MGGSRGPMGRARIRLWELPDGRRRASGLPAVAFLMLLGAAVTADAQAPLPVKPTRLVTDLAGVMAPSNAAALERKLVAYDDSTSTQIAVVVEATTGGEAPFDRSFRMADAWGVGGRRDNGVLIYVASEDREIFIQNGYGAEDRLTDAMTKRIIEQVIIPRFRAGRYYEGLDAGTDVMIDLLQGRYRAEDQPLGSGGLSPLMTLLLFFAAFVLISWLLSRGGGGGPGGDDEDGGYWRGGRYRGPYGRGRGGWVVVPGGGWGGGRGGFGGGGFGGGGFGGFGGGGFGGGGAGGSW